MDTIKVIYERTTKRAARRPLVGRVRTRMSPDKGRFVRDDVTRLLDAAWNRYDEAVGSLPAQPTAGSTMPAESGTAFNVVHCPVATYFRKHGAGDLCVASWCNLDFPLSEMTNQKLVRSKTLAGGADHCDFRILPVVS